MGQEAGRTAMASTRTNSLAAKQTSLPICKFSVVGEYPPEKIQTQRCKSDSALYTDEYKAYRKGHFLMLSLFRGAHRCSSLKQFASNLSRKVSFLESLRSHGFLKRSCSAASEPGETLQKSVGNSGKARKKAMVKRVTSWSHYLETSGAEGAVETAEEWMLDMSQLFLGHKFASGMHSRLYHGIYKQKVVAVKVMKPPDEDDAISTRLDHQFSHEVTLLSRLHHCNIVKFVAACKKPPVFCVVTEYLPGGSLRTFLHKNEPGSLSVQLVIKMSLDIARGMEYLHSQGVIHRDLKSENLVLTDDLHVKVADFGVSCLESHRDSMKGFMGTYRWMAPEMINEKPYSRKVDVYSFGIVLWELVTGLIPFEEMTAVQAAFAVSQKNVRPAIPTDCPKEFCRLMQQCWATNPEKRPEFGQIVKCLEQFEDSLTQKIKGGSKINPMKNGSFFGCFTGC